jgi:hypothetical protein
MTTPKGDIGRLFALTTITAFYGLFFAIPLRKYYIRMCLIAFSPNPVAYSSHSEAAPGLPDTHCYSIHDPFAS